MEKSWCSFWVLMVLYMSWNAEATVEGKRSAEQLLTRVMRNDFLIRALRSYSNTVNAMLAEKHTYFHIKIIFRMRLMPN